jgi:hypothetical protein
VWTRAEAAGAVEAALRREAEGWATVLPARFEPRGAQVLEG